MQPLVTVVIPTLNRTRYVSEALASVLAQDYAHLDILVSDNGSGGGPHVAGPGMARGDRRVRFRRNRTTVPLVEHFNQLIAAARGEYFILLCDDDVMSPNFVSELVGVATAHPRVNVVLPRCEIVDADGHTVRMLAAPASDTIDGPDLLTHWFDFREPQYFVMNGTVLYRTEVVRRFGGYPSFVRGLHSENVPFLQCAISGPVGFARHATFKFRVHPHSHSTASTARDLAAAARQFIRHVRTDPMTVDALAALPQRQRDDILTGVRRMTAQDFLRQIDFYDAPLTVPCLRKLFAYRFDTVLYREVVLDYRRRLRTKWTLRRGRLNPSCPPSAR